MNEPTVTVLLCPRRFDESKIESFPPFKSFEGVTIEEAIVELNQLS